MRILVINGPNMNMLGIREPEIYGEQTYDDLVAYITGYAKEKNIDVSFFQSNHEGAIVDRIHQAFFDKENGIVINPAAYTHTSLAIADALRAVMIPSVEVHISDVQSREDYRKVSFTSEAVRKVIAGHGFMGYTEALDFLTENR